jgi:ribosomal-protein-alanine N-acetyltransferase
MVQVVDDAAGFVTWTAGSFDKLTKYWEIRISLLPEWRGRGLGWQAQAMLCDYLPYAYAGSAHPGCLIHKH